MRCWGDTYCSKHDKRAIFVDKLYLHNIREVIGLKSFLISLNIEIF